jgi:hypothetical protein
MATITLNNEQLRLVQTALDLYSRIGILHFDPILDHPTIYKSIMKQFSPNKKFEVGDQTTRGEIVEIGENYIKTKGQWNTVEEIKTWDDIENIEFSPDWGLVHKTRDEIRDTFAEVKKLTTGKNYGTNSSMGIHNPSVDESCRQAFDLVQVIRHEFWKNDPNKSNITVDSNIHFSSNKNSNNIKVEIDK